MGSGARQAACWANHVGGVLANSGGGQAGPECRERTGFDSRSRLRGPESCDATDADGRRGAAGDERRERGARWLIEFRIAARSTWRRSSRTVLKVTTADWP